MGNLGVDDTASVREPDLPPAEVTVKRRQTGGAEFLAVLVTMGLMPFVQAAAAVLGTKFGDDVDSRTRGAVRRLLVRIRQQPGIPRPTELEVRVTVALTDDGTGARVLVDEDLPAVAVAQLVQLTRSRSMAPQGTVMWLPQGSGTGRWCVESEGQLVSAWNPDVKQWAIP